jgi:hypothetical protein
MRGAIEGGVLCDFRNAVFRLGRHCTAGRDKRSALRRFMLSTLSETFEAVWLRGAAPARRNALRLLRPTL